jgi:protein-tyrosine kinase
MSRIDRALKRRRQDAQAHPEAASDAAEVLSLDDVDDSIIPAELSDRFPNEGIADLREAAVEVATHSEPLVETPVPVLGETSVPVLGETSVPVLGEQPGTMAVFRGFNRTLVGKVVSGPRMDSESAEQYRRLAAALHHVQVERGIKKVMVTSAVAGEGKTLTALNLALTLSESYRRRVVLIDADLRCPRLHELLDVANVAGLNDALKDTRQTKLPLVQVSPRLSALPAGRPDPDPMGALTSRRMALILDDTEANFDWVIVDAPPVVLLPDTNLLAAMVDVAIVVVQAGRTAYDLVDRAIQAVGRQRVLGVVLNDVHDTKA